MVPLLAQGMIAAKCQVMNRAAQRHHEIAKSVLLDLAAALGVLCVTEIAERRLIDELTPAGLSHPYSRNQPPGFSR